MDNIDKYKTTQTFFLSIYNQASMIEREYSDFIIKPPEGIYRVGDIYPCIQNNKRYYYQRKIKNHQTITAQVVDFNTITDTVFDENGNIVLTSFVMKNKEQYLKNLPTVPAIGLIIVELLIKRFIESISPWTKHSTYNSKITNCFTSEGVDLFVSGQLDLICNSLYSQVNDFIGNDTWHVYFVKFVGLDLMIEKTRDFRVIQWEEDHGHEYCR